MAFLPAGFLSAASASPQKPAPAALVLDGATVVDVESGKLLEAQRVVVVGNRIQAMGVGSAVPLPKGAQVVDARGKYLIPGLWDMHTHRWDAGDSRYSLFIANGVTGIREAWSPIPVDSLVRWRREILAGQLVGPPRQLLAGDQLKEEDSASAQRHINALKAAGANFLKTYPFNFVLAAAARRAGLPFGGHVGGPHGPISAIDASDSGISIIDHLYSGGLDTLCVGPKATVERCQPVAERFRHNGTWFVPTLVRLQHDGFFAQPSRPTEAVYLRFLEQMTGFWAGTLASGNWLRDSTINSTSFGSAGRMRIPLQVGLPFLAGTDAGANVVKGVPPGFSLHAELAIYVAEGMPPLTALQSATLNPAKLLHATDSLGTVAPGKLADLVLLDADPLADITNTTAIQAVVANGRYFDRAALDQLIADARTHYLEEP